MRVPLCANCFTVVLTCSSLKSHSPALSLRLVWWKWNGNCSRGRRSPGPTLNYR